MNQPVRRTSFLSFCKDFLRDAWSWRVGGMGVMVLAVIYCVFFQKKALVFFPATNDSSIDFYNDQLDGGNSTLGESFRSDTCIGLSFTLKKGFIGPYAGMGINSKNNRELDIAGYNKVSIQVSGQGITHIWAYLITKDKHVSDTTSRLLFRHSCQNMDLTPQKQTVELDIKDFKTPDWWFAGIKQTPDQFTEPEWNRLMRVAIVSGFNPIVDKDQSIRLYSIRFERDNTGVWWLMLLIELAVVAGAMLVYYLKTKPEPPTPITITYKAVTLEEKRETAPNFLDYIHENFADAELSLLQVAKHTGVNQRTISDTISQQFNCNFKTYINQIRINEARRLLKESDLNSSEIAYKVGFGSPSSFNRVFKSLTGKSPSEFVQVDD